MTFHHASPIQSRLEFKWRSRENLSIQAQLDQVGAQPLLNKIYRDAEKAAACSHTT